MMAPPRIPIPKRLRDNSKPDGECLIWTGNVGKDGYGVLSIGRKQFRAHRVAYAEANGVTIPPTTLVCHRCDRPRCINPQHLFAGSPSDNTRDMIAKGRGARLRDQDHPNCKISHEQRQVIRERRNSGETLVAIAQDYGVTFQTISAICKGVRSYGTA